MEEAKKRFQDIQQAYSGTWSFIFLAFSFLIARRCVGLNCVDNYGGKEEILGLKSSLINGVLVVERF